MDGGKVICVGFHKTGTSSLGRALERLGLRVAGPFGVRWPDIAERALPEALDRIGAVDAVQDNPWPLLYRELDEALPGSRFILTLRPTDRWLESVVGHFGGRSTPMREWIYGEGAGDPVGRESWYGDRYQRHNDEVQTWFADRPGDLLVLRLTEGEGWAELGDFLDLPVPDEPFPHVNADGAINRLVNRSRDRVRRVIRR